MLFLLVVAWALMLLVLLYPPKAKADELHLLDPTLLTFEGYNVQNNRDLYLAIDSPGSDKFGSDEHWRYGAAAKFNYDLLSYGFWGLYWKNNVHMAATDCCVRHVGWEFEQGLRLGQHVDVFHYHHSQHVLDEGRQSGRFPLVDNYGLRFVLIEKGRK
jgi:hypothetical protein